jgi:hypothetical protein
MRLKPIEHRDWETCLRGLPRPYLGRRRTVASKEEILKAGGGKRKGGTFERKICVKFSLWLSAGKLKDLFWRSSMSGGRATITLRRGEVNRQAGDITATRPEGHALTDRFLFECKHVRNIGLEAFVVADRGPIYGWWKKARKQARDHGREPVLIVKGNNTPILLITKIGSMMNIHPIARLKSCEIGLLERQLRYPFAGLLEKRSRVTRTVLQFPGDQDLVLK